MWRTTEQTAIMLYMIMWLVDWFLEYSVLATFRVISGWVLTCESAHSWQLYSAAPLGDQATSTVA